MPDLPGGAVAAAAPLLLGLAASGPAGAQPAPPPAVGVVEAVVIRPRRPDGPLCEHPGRLGFVDTEVGQQTDTAAPRGTVPDPLLPAEAAGGTRPREPPDGEFATMILEAAEPVQAPVAPREAVLSDRRGESVVVVGGGRAPRRSRGAASARRSSPA
jgi:hypothetical protein